MPGMILTVPFALHAFIVSVKGRAAGAVLTGSLTARRGAGCGVSPLGLNRAAPTASEKQDVRAAALKICEVVRFLIHENFISSSFDAIKT